MKKLIYIFLLLLPFISKAQVNYGPQDSVVIQGITCLLHTPTNYNTEATTIRHPFAIMFQGAGEYGTQASKLLKNGLAWALKTGAWDGKAYNPTTHIQEQFITLCPLSPSSTSGLSFDQQDAIITYMFTHYRIDSTAWAPMGLSRGAGVLWDYATHLYGYNWATSPPTPVFKQPSHIPCVIIDAAAESNYFDPVQYIVQDGTWAHGYGDLVDGDSHAQNTKANIDSINKYTNPDKGMFSSYICTTANFGHGCWNENVFDSTKKYTIDGLQMNAYQEILYRRRGSVTPPNSISITGVSGNPFCVTTVSGTSTTVTFTSVGTYPSGNKYVLQLSDPNGSFSTPTNLDSITSSANSGTITATIKANTVGGTKYRLRIISRNPSVIGNDNGADLTIKLASANVTPSSSQTISSGTNGNILTVNLGSTPNSIAWYDGATPLGVTTSTYTPSGLSVGTHNITAHAVFPCATVITNAVSITVTSTSPSRIYVTKAADNSVQLNGCNGSFKYNPGDTIVLTKAQSPYGRITLSCLNNVTIINEDSAYINDYVNGSSVTPGAIVMINCNHIRVTGTGKAGLKYGITNSSTLGRGFAIEVHGVSSYVEIDHIAILGKDLGITVKEEQNDNQCYDSLAFPRLVMHDYKIHDNYIFKVINEGMYLGSTAPNSNDTSVNNQHPIAYCPNGDTNRTLTARLGNFEIYNNIIDSTGRGGIQLASCDSGTNLIHDNHVTRSGYGGTYGQGNGIVLGGYTHASVYNNYVSSTTAASIFILGSGLNRVYNNTIDSSGMRRDGPTGTNVPNIEIDTRNTSNPSPGHPSPELLTFQVFDNTVLNKTSNYNIIIDRTYNTYDPTGSYICNSGNNIYNFYQVPYSTNCGVSQSIATGTMPVSSFCVTPTAGSSSFLLGFVSQGTFNSNNQYRAEMSDKNGSFASPTVIGFLNSNGNSGNIPCIIPAGTQPGSGYKVRVTSTFPVIIGSVTAAFTVNLASASISPAGEQDILTGANGDVLTASETISVTGRQWRVNGSNVTGQTGSTYTPHFGAAGTYLIDYTATSACGTITSSNQVTVIVTDPPPPPPQTLSTGSISGSPFCLLTGSTVTIAVPYSSSVGAVYPSGNQFKVKLSSPTGSFAVNNNIGTVTTTAASGTIICVVPVSAVVSGSGFRIRVVSTNPKITGSNNGSDLTFIVATTSIAPTGAQSITQGTNGSTLTVTNGATPTGIQWYDGNVLISGATGTTFTPNFNTVGVHNVSAHVTFATCGTIISNSVQITVNAIPPPPPPDTICVIQKTPARDTLIPKTFSRIIHVPVTKDTTICQYFHFLWMTFSYGCVTKHDTITFHDSTELYDSLVPSLTTPRDTSVCTVIPSYTMGIFYDNRLLTSTIDQIIDTVRDYIGAKTIRQGYNIGGSNVYTNSVKKEVDSGLDVLLTLTNSSDGAPGYGHILDSLIQIAKPIIVSVGNETTQNSTSMKDHLKDVSAAIPIAHSHGVKVSPGAIVKDVVFYMAWYWDHHGKSDSATWLINYTHIDTTSIQGRLAIKQYDTLYTGIDTMSVKPDYIDVHLYEVTELDTSITTPSGLIPIVANFLYTRFGSTIPLICTEFGIYNHNCSLLSTMVQQMINAHFKYMYYYDGSQVYSTDHPAIKNQDCIKSIISP